jgi:hypothetical protein
VLRELERIVDPLFRRVGIHLDGPGQGADENLYSRQGRSGLRLCRQPLRPPQRTSSCTPAVISGRGGQGGSRSMVDRRTSRH